MQTARQRAYQRIVQDLPVAARLYPVRQWLDAAPAEGLLRELMCCVLASDCWAAQLPCPREGVQGKAWDGYFGVRLESTGPLLWAALARWAVLDGIPSNWIPEEHVRAEVGARFALAGFHTEVTGLRLIPPVTGGREWVARDCGAEVANLVARADASPVAVILHWPQRTAAAVVTAAGGRLKAFGAAFGADGFDFDAADLAGVAIVARAEPPASRLSRLVRALGLGELMWRAVRCWRLHRGVNPLAAI